MCNAALGIENDETYCDIAADSNDDNSDGVRLGLARNEKRSLASALFEGGETVNRDQYLRQVS